MSNENSIPPYFQQTYPEFMAQLAELVRPLLADACLKNQRHLTFFVTLKQEDVIFFVQRADAALQKKLRQDLATALGLKPRDITFSMWDESYRLITISTASMRKAADAALASALAADEGYLANGVLSGRQCLIAAKQSGLSGEGVETWINEIAWRDFYIHILYHYPRVSMGRAFKEETEALAWNTPGEHFEAWKEGRTGIPIVDAAMRQLKATGWMHNRLRMITAMFLTKNLFIDWRLGEAWFMQNLVDGFLASNNGGWQWSASTGTDAAPYFRVFNPVTQSERFDPEGEFIRNWVPELAKLDNKRIHDPSKGGVIPKGYPRPIVDLKESRKEAIARFQALKD